MKRGLTLIELLVVMVITLILGAGLVTLFRSVAQNRAEQASSLKNEAQLNFVLDNMVRLMTSAGFGIDSSKMRFKSNEDDANGVIFISSNGRTLVFNTLASTAQNRAGCWGVQVRGGSPTVKPVNDDVPPRSSTTYQECQNSDISSGVRLGILTKSPNCVNNCLVFHVPEEIRPVEITLGGGSQPRGCLNGTLSLQMGGRGAGLQPVLNCVGHLRFRYLIRDNNNEIVPADAPPNFGFGNLAGVRVCMMVQLSESPGSRAESIEPEYSQRCGGGRLSQLNTALNNPIGGRPAWTWRKWKVVEFDVVMPNLFVVN
ncbi:MAG: prepilin-type N-terminal cleavage/methylation domain-containing protein [Aquificaceae bacterium]